MIQSIDQNKEANVENKWKLALDAAGDGMWDLNLQTGEMVFSEKWHDIFGYDFSDVSTWDGWAAKIHPEDKARYQKNVDEYLAGKTPSYTIEQRYLCKDGSYKWILSRGVVVSNTDDGKPLRAVGTHHDIQAHKMAIEALKTSRDTFASVFNHSGIGIALISPDGKWLDVNGVVCAMTGYSKEELLKLTHYDVTYPDDRDIDRGLIDQMVDKDIYTYTIEKRYINKQNKIVVGLLTVSLVWDSNNNPKFFIVQVIDITKKKELENDLKQKNAELQSARLSLQQKVNQMGTLNTHLAGILTEPATNIKALTDALLSMHDKGEGSATLRVLGKTMTRDELIAHIGENSTAILNTLAAVESRNK